jgi:hypothetical protein
MWTPIEKRFIDSLPERFRTKEAIEIGAKDNIKPCRVAVLLRIFCRQSKRGWWYKEVQHD